MANTDDIEMRLADMDIENEENEELVIDVGVEEEINRFELCLVGRFLTEKNINVRVMKSKMADLWRPAKGITIKDIKPGLFLFQFYHVDDMLWVKNGGPWSFDNALLVLNGISPGEDPTKVPLVDIDFWIQIYDLSVGYMSEAVGKQLGNFFGSFLEYDSNNNSSIWREFMRLKIRLDVRKPLKRKKKICKRDKTEVIVHCKYERLGDFCFTCGLLTHTERFCQKKFEGDGSLVSKEWGAWLRAPPRRNGGGGRSKWLREEGGSDWSSKLGNDNYYQHDLGDSISRNKETDQGRKEVVSIPDLVGGSTVAGKVSKIKEGNQFKKSGFGPQEEEELSGLMFEERKRQRSENEGLFEKVVSGNNSTTDSGLSGLDYSDSSPQFLAKLAVQASQPK